MCVLEGALCESRSEQINYLTRLTNAFSFQLSNSCLKNKNYYAYSYNTGVLSIMSKIPEISVGIQMERSVSVSSDRNIRDHLWRWSTYFGWNIPIEIRRSIFDKLVLCPK